MTATPEITTGIDNKKPSPRNGYGYRVGNKDYKFWEVCGVKFSRKHHATQFANEFYPEWNGEGEAEAEYEEWLMNKKREAEKAGDYEAVKKAWKDLETLETY
jgi:hypothetical protein